MPPVDLDITRLGEEMAAYGDRLRAVMERLCAADDVSRGVTPREVVYREDKLTLYRYLPQPGVKAEPNPVPLLIVYALVNRPYMTDLQADRSMIRHLLDTGQSVYLIDWGYPDSADRFMTLDDYVNGYIDRCVTQLCRQHGVEQVNLLGICQGGVLSLCYSALHPERVRNLVTMVTPVDFKTPDNMLSAWVQHLDVDLLVDTEGNIPGELLNWTFLSLKPFSLGGRKYVDMLERLQDDEALANFLRMEQWIFDSPDQAGEAFRQFIKQFYQQNGLIRGEVELAGRRVALERIRCPLLNIYAEQDHLVPPAASTALRGRTGSSDYSELSYPVGHIGIYVSARAQPEVPQAVGEWLNQR